MERVSPVNYSSDISKVTEFEVSRIISLYKEINISVDRFFKDVKTVELYECNRTGYRFYYPFTIFGDDQFYQDLYTTLPSYYFDERWEYSFALSNIPAGSHVLEIGSGAGIFLGKLKLNGCTAVGLELNTRAIADSRKNGLDVHDKLIETFAEQTPGRFDIVCSFQVLEHVTDVRSFITAGLKSLKQGGKLILSVPNSHPYFLKNDKYHTLNLPPHHAGLWDKKAFGKLSQEFSLKLLDLKTEPLREYKEWYQVQKKHYKTAKPWLGFLMNLVPRPVYKSFVRMFSSSIQGAYITAIYQKL